MSRTSASGILVIGVGNDYRGDDAAGLVVARQVKESGGCPSMVLEHAGDGAALIELWKNASTVILIDAVCSGVPPGTIHRLDASSQSIPARMFRNSTHAFSLAEAVEVARALNQLPRCVVVYGIEGWGFDEGTGLSPEVQRAVQIVVQRVLQETHTPENS